VLLLYKMLNHGCVEESPVFRTADVERAELHVRKLVDATVFDGYVYEHTSNAWEGAEVIYMEPRPEKNGWLPAHNLTIYGCTIEYYDCSGECPVLVQTSQFKYFDEMLTRLLDHFTMVGGREMEVRYTMLDETRGVILSFVVPEK
jgi:hypothetical protein